MTDNDFYYKEELIFDSFVIINKIKKSHSFTELTYKDLYEDNPLFEKLIKTLNNISNDTFSKEKKDILNKIGDFFSKNRITNDILEKIIENGIPNEILSLRPLIWKALIGYLPISDLSKWKEKIIKNSKRYNQLKKETLLNININNYINDNLISKEDKDLLLQIDKDLPRTRGEINFFKLYCKKNKKKTNYEIMKRILFIYAKQHPELKYIQGMNEILAVIYYTFENDDNPFMLNYSESDSYYTFEILLEEIKQVFIMDDINFSQLFIVIEIKFIKNILQKLDKDLYNHFENENVSLETFLMRWLLVLFAQEFQLDTTINFWDRMFTQKNKINFLCYVSVSLLIYNRNLLLNMDCVGIMEFSKKFGEKFTGKEISEIVKKAIEIKEKIK
jgi:hypothetical protein